MAHKDHDKNKRSSRRTFLAAGGAAALGFTILPRHVLGGPGQVPPSERVNIAGIGVGSMGGSDIATFSKLGANIVALCDVDQVRAAGCFAALVLLALVVWLGAGPNTKSAVPPEIPETIVSIVSEAVGVSRSVSGV